MKQFNENMLIIAREIRKLTQEELAYRVGLSQGTISKYEQGALLPSSDDLERIAICLSFPREFFFREGKRYGAETGELFHRKKSKAGALDVKRIDSYTNLLRLDALYHLLRDVDVQTYYAVPQIELVDYKNDAELVAEAVRVYWDMPSGPVDHMIRRMEAAGCMVYVLDFGNDDIDENVQWIPPAPPIVVVNKRAPGDRLRFSLAHALGHLVMHHGKIPYQTMEKEADKFASAFLMPAEDIRPNFAPVTINHMKELKAYWKTSIAALIVRSHEIGEIDDTRYRSLFQQLSRKGYRKNEPVKISPEKPKRVEMLLSLYREQLDYDDNDFANMLKVRKEDFIQPYYPHRPLLRLI